MCARGRLTITPRATGSRGAAKACDWKPLLSVAHVGER